MKIMAEIYTDKISGIAKKEGPIEEGQLEKPSSCRVGNKQASQAEQAQLAGLQFLTP